MAVTRRSSAVVPPRNPVCPEGVRRGGPKPPPSAASCFATFLLPHILFVADPAMRRQFARICCLAWNIGLFPDGGERARHIEQTVDIFLKDPEAPLSPDAREGIRDDLEMLAGLKRDLFPWQLTLIRDADLETAARVDTLIVDTGEGVEHIELARATSIAGLPYIAKVLVQFHSDTKTQRRTLEGARRDTPELLAHIVTPDMLTTYCVQRADLRGYHRMLEQWRREAADPELEAGIERLLGVVNEIEVDTKGVLDILADTIGARYTSAIHP